MTCGTIGAFLAFLDPGDHSRAITIRFVAGRALGTPWT